MLAHLGPCENTPVFLQKSVGDLLVGSDFSCVSPCCARSMQQQFSPLSLLLGWWRQQSFVDSKSEPAFGTFTGTCCEMVPRSDRVISDRS